MTSTRNVPVPVAGVQVDPAQGDLSRARPADLVLVTDVHGDHLNPDALAKVRKPGAPVVMPAAVQSQAGDRIKPPIEVLANGQTKRVAGVAVEAIPMYNLQRGPVAGQLFHTRGFDLNLFSSVIKRGRETATLPSLFSPSPLASLHRTDGHLTSGHHLPLELRSSLPSLCTVSQVVLDPI